MPGMGGLELLKRIRDEHPQTEVIILTGQGSIESAVEAMRAGAHDYLTKPVNTDEIREKLYDLFSEGYSGKQAFRQCGKRFDIGYTVLLCVRREWKAGPQRW